LRIVILYSINFNKEILKSTEQDYKKVKITAEQSKTIQEISKLLLELIPLSELILKDCILHTLKEWQIKNNKLINEIVDMPIGRKLNAIKEMFNIGKKKLKSALTEPKKKSEIIIDIAFEKVFKSYMKNINEHQK